MNKNKLIAGVDEVGRGSWVGPVFSAAVILKKNINKNLLKDSKKISLDRLKVNKRKNEATKFLIL